jgi:glutathione S-transferase
MKLYDHPLAPNPRRVRVFIAEKAIEIPRVEIDLGTGENQKAEFLAINPTGQVPVLVLDDGTAIAESVAICRYLESQHPTPALFGADALTQALVEMWHRRVEIGVNQPVERAVRNSHAMFAGRGSGPEGAQSSDFAEAGKSTAEATCDWIERELATRPYVAGDSYSVADIALLIAVDYARVAKLRLREGRPNLDRWYNEVAGRPSAKA